MCNKNQKSDREWTFWHFLKDYSVEIPIIQRDYAQGRLGEEYLRQTFLHSLKDALDKKPPYKLKLDFVYGSDGKKLQPLDGQQRLTTLWLLHWYIALRANKLDEEVCSVLRRFSYETRITSREFCEKLCKPEHFQTLNNNKIVDFIRNSTWFYSSWQQDPTIQSMLRMIEGTKINDKRGVDIIDGLEELFEGVDQETFTTYWENLISNAPIVFYFLPLKDFGLSDDLYIKMNARGKQLSPFENIKASIIGNMRQEYNQAIGNEKSEWDKLLNGSENFPNKIDNDWTNMLWSYSLNEWEKLPDDKKLKSYPMVDTYFMNLFSYVHQTRFFILNKNNNLKVENFDDTFASQEKFFFQRENLEFLYDFLDVWYNVSRTSNIDSFFRELLGKEGLTLWNNDEHSNLFVECINKGVHKDTGMDVKLKVLFYAISKYCISRECYSVTDELKLFVRICRNLIESIYQFNGGDVRCDTNIRLTSWNNYKRAIDRIVNNIVDGKVWFDNVDEKDFGDIEHEIYKIDFDKYHRNFIEYWEDKEMFKGCLRAVLPSINNNSVKDINAALTAFEQTSDIEKVQLLVAFGYEGLEVGYCDYYTRKRLFFGNEGKERKEGKWDVIFRRDWKNVKEPFAKYVLAFNENDCPNVEKLLEKELKNSTWNSFKYYMLKYSDFVKGNEDTHYYAVRGKVDDLDIINIEYSPSPLMKYHCDPFAYVVCKKIDKEIKQLKCWNKNSNRSSVYLHRTLDGDSECVLELHNCKDGWRLHVNDEKIRNSRKLYEVLTSKVEKNRLEDCENGDKFIPIERGGKDLIELGEDIARACREWVNEVFNNNDQALSASAG